MLGGLAFLGWFDKYGRRGRRPRRSCCLHAGFSVAGFHLNRDFDFVLWNSFAIHFDFQFNKDELTQFVKLDNFYQYEQFLFVLFVNVKFFKYFNDFDEQ